MGDGSTTFTLPDLRRKTTIGAGGTAISGPANTVGSSGGAETHTLTTAEMPSHTHSYSAGNYVSGYTGTLEGRSGAPTGKTTGTAGSNGAHNNMQPSAVVRKLIKAA